MKNSITINDLPKFSPWPARLFDLEPWDIKLKTKKEVLREYEFEKWGLLLKKIKQLNKKITIDEADKLVFDHNKEILCSINDKLVSYSESESHNYYINLVNNIIKKYMPAKSLVELGAGYGSVILALAHKRVYRNTSLIAGEYTKSGLKIMQFLSESENFKLILGNCNFRSRKITSLQIPKGSIIFTSYALTYIRKLTNQFITSMISFQPKVVIHFEPCYEHYHNETLLQMMRKKYIDINGYNTNLVSLIHEKQKQGLLTILDEKVSVFGNNPLLPVSVIIWKPI